MHVSPAHTGWYYQRGAEFLGIHLDFNGVTCGEKIGVHPAVPVVCGEFGRVVHVLSEYPDTSVQSRHLSAIFDWIRDDAHFRVVTVYLFEQITYVRVSCSA